MNNGIKLFARAKQAAKRKLHTWSIYPYPHNYINTTQWPSYQVYRENLVHPKWAYKERATAMAVHRIFWTYIVYMGLHHPEAFIGHGVFPKGDIYTDEELGIPPDEEGSYKEWKAKQMEAQNEKV